MVADRAWKRMGRMFPLVLARCCLFGWSNPPGISSNAPQRVLESVEVCVLWGGKGWTWRGELHDPPRAPSRTVLCSLELAVCGEALFFFFFFFFPFSLFLSHYFSLLLRATARVCVCVPVRACWL